MDSGPNNVTSRECHARQKNNQYSQKDQDTKEATLKEQKEKTTDPLGRYLILGPKEMGVVIC
jgi:hypothetical protein